MKSSFIIVFLSFLIPTISYSQSSSQVKQKARELLMGLKDKGEYPLGGSDTLIDLNNDHYMDVLIEYYGASGTGLKNRVQVFLYNPSRNKFKECEQLSGLANPIFYFNKGIVTVYYVANGGGDATKLKWNLLKLDTLEYISIVVDNSVKNYPTFTLSSFNYITKKRRIRTLSTMELPKEYRYWDYVSVIKKNGG